MDDLHISERLHKLLTPLTKEEKQQLKENIEHDGEVTEPISIWDDGEKQVIIDGMHRWEIIQGTNIPYQTRELIFDDYEAAELWILNHQLGRRNAMNVAALRKVRGKLYNLLKGNRGGKLSSKYHDDTLGGDAAEEVAKKAGVSAITVKRDGARLEAFDKLTNAAQIIADKLNDADVKKLSKLSEADQNDVAGRLRRGQAASVAEAMKQAGVKPKGRQRASGGSGGGKGKPKPSAASVIDGLSKKHVGPIARGLTKAAELNGGEGAQFKRSNDGLNEMIRGMQEMRKGKK